jgi:hypothetical protein
VPPRDALGVTNIYTGTHGYANASQHNLPPVTVYMGTNVSDARLKMRISGHGFGGNLNCSEFCPRNNKLRINGADAYDHYVWRKCGTNPLYPQGGTWLYDRAAWCPGAEVTTKDFELTPFVLPGDSMTIDYDLQPGYNWNGQGSWPYYALESQLITYTSPNFNLDVAMEEILSPNNEKLYNRSNPMCGKPEIAIKNNGKTTLTSAVIHYGPRGGRLQEFTWTGSLSFQDTVHVTLPPIDWTDWTADSVNHFDVTVDAPNGLNDGYPTNNSLSTVFLIPPTYDNMVVFHFKTNHLAYAESWQLYDANDSIIYQNGTLEQNTVYIDTLSLEKGCYRLVIRNSEGEGLQYWANMPPYGNGTAGYARIKNMEEKIIKSFQGDFGSIIGQSFTVGMTIDVPETNPKGYVNIYPNPGRGRFHVSLIFDRPENVALRVVNGLGQELWSKDLKAIENGAIPVDITGCQPGVYFVSIATELGAIVRKVVIY